MNVSRALVLVCAAMIVSACGGRAIVDGAGGSDGASGGASAHGGAPPQAGTVGVGGACDTGCLDIGCGAGMTLTKVPGACCPVCMADQNQPTCADGRDDYSQFLTAHLFAYQSCYTDADCTVVLPSNSCSTCQSVAASTSQSVPLATALNQIAQIDCVQCGPVPEGKCRVPATTCLDERCTLVPF